MPALSVNLALGNAGLLITLVAAAVGAASGAVALIGGRVETEASGNVTLETVHAIGQTGVTFISSGALTHSVVACDISLNIST